MTTIDTINARINAFRDEARNAKDTYTRARESINADTTRTPDWKRDQITKARTTLATKLEQLQQNEQQYLTNITKELETTVYGTNTGHDILAYRDAQDRVRAIHFTKEDDALDLYRQAERSGDTTLKQALSERAVDAGWARVQDTYTAEHPERGKAIEALNAINTFVGDERHGLQTAMDYSVPRD